MPASVGDWLTHLSGWPRLGIAFLAGLLSALAFAPFGIVPLLLVALAVLVLLLDGAATDPKKYRRAFFVGWAFGFGQFLLGFYWIGYPFLVDAARHGWQMPFALVFFPGGLALFPAAAAAAAMAWWKPGLSRIFLFAVAFTLAEYLRGTILTGFPWNLSGYGWGASLAVLQSTSVVGIYGLSLLTILFGASLAALLRPGNLAKATLPLAMTALFALVFAAGAWRLSVASDASVPGVRLRLVQPNTLQSEKYKREFVERNWKRLLDLTLQPAAGGIAPTHVIWPEAATPFLVARVPVALDQIAILTARNRVIMTGSDRVETMGDGTQRYFNSFYIFGNGGQALGVYDKHHLVPFGEYVPFAELFSKIGIAKLTRGEAGFSAGPGNRTFEIPGAPPAGILICYEILFPGSVSNPNNRPGWFVNVTDDSWFGPSSGPRQHLLAARVRAIEEGTPVARAANTGISAIIDAYGRITASLALNERGVVDANLPISLGPPPFVRWGALAFWLLLAAISGLAYTLGRRSSTGR